MEEDGFTTIANKKRWRKNRKQVIRMAQVNDAAEFLDIEGKPKTFGCSGQDVSVRLLRTRASKRDSNCFLV